MFDPPVSTPISRITAIAASRIAWYSRSLKVCAGATVIESPVCTPMGSKFSIEHTMMTLSARSRITSSSYSFQPDPRHRILEEQTVFRLLDRLQLRANQRDTVLLKHAAISQFHREIQRSLPTHRRQHG